MNPQRWPGICGVKVTLAVQELPLVKLMPTVQVPLESTVKSVATPPCCMGVIAPIVPLPSKSKVICNEELCPTGIFPNTPLAGGAPADTLLLPVAEP